MNWQLFGIVGWILVLIGWLLQRPSVQNQISNFNLQIGFGNQSNVSQTQTHSTPRDATEGKGESTLAKAGSFATLAGLAIQLYQFFTAVPK